jgi:hypothetical protein
MKIFYPKGIEPKAREVIDRTPTAEQITQAETFLKAIKKEMPYDDVYTMLEAEMPHVFSGSEMKELVDRVQAELHPVEAVEPIEDIINPK